MARAPTRGGEGEILPRYVFLEPLLADARVLEVGAVSLTGGRSASFLKDRGAASVLALDEAEAIERARKDRGVAREGLDFRPGDYKELPAGLFDLIFLHSAAPLATDHQRIAILKQIFLDMGNPDDEAFVRARIAYFHQVGYYTLGVKEDRAQRLRLLPLYIRFLTGR